jgi:hypothetical protein
MSPPKRSNWRSLAVAGLVFAVPMGVLIFFATRRIEVAIPGGLVSGAGFAGLLAAFLLSVRSTKAFEIGGELPSFDPGERVIHRGLANHFKGAEGVGGKLYLTERRLRFRSHTLNIQVHDESYPLDQIASAEATRTLGILPNGLRVWMKDGRRERFVVHGHEEWAEAISKAIEER